MFFVLLEQIVSVETKDNKMRQNGKDMTRENGKDRTRHNRKDRTRQRSKNLTRQNTIFKCMTILMIQIRKYHGQREPPGQRDMIWNV